MDFRRNLTTRKWLAESIIRPARSIRFSRDIYMRIISLPFLKSILLKTH